jgi:hypothetical protein
MARLLQLSGALPAPLQPGSESRLAPVLFDFRYFRDQDACERRLEASAELSALDEHFRIVRHILLRTSMTA